MGGATSKKCELCSSAELTPDGRSDLGNTPLMVAAAAPHGAAAVEVLLAHGADITPRNKAGRTALRNAAYAGDTNTVRLLLARARELQSLEDVVRDAGPSVAVAARNSFHEIVRMLLEHDADPNRSLDGRGHALNSALLGGNPDIARTLISQGNDLNCLTHPGDVPTVVLAVYSEVDDASIVRLLQQRGADLNPASSEQHTALTWARLRGHQQLIDTLVNAGASEGQAPHRPAVPARTIDLHGDNKARLIVQSVQRSVDLLQRSSEKFLDVRSNCVSCHHQNLPGVAIAWVREHGFSVRQATLDRMLESQVENWWPRIERAYEFDSPFPVPPRFLGYGMWSFAELGYRPDELTRGVSWYLASTQQPDGRWVSGMLRPPLEGDEILATMLAMRSLQFYPLPGRERETEHCIERTRRWFEQAQPRTHQEHVYRMLGLAWARAEPDALVAEVQMLLQTQRADGGWAQLPHMESDAWATSQPPVTIHPQRSRRPHDTLTSPAMSNPC